MTPKYFDAHSHIQFPHYDSDRGETIRRMRQEGVFALVVGTSRESSRQAFEFVRDHDGFCGTVGIHPTDKLREGFDELFFNTYAEDKKIVATGECGLDYVRAPDGSKEETRRQRVLFEKQIEFALEKNLPLMVHGRPRAGSMDAYRDILDILNSYVREHGERVRGNIHFFVGDKDTARQFLDLGFTLSFTGVITFTRDYDETVGFIPRERILSETDCPFVAPVPYRGKRNEPVYVKEVVKQIALIRNENFEKVREALVANAMRVFDIKFPNI